MSIISKLFDLPEKVSNKRNGEYEPESQLILFELKEYADASKVANYLLEDKSVIMSMKSDEERVIQQAVSFLDGVLHVIGGDMKEVGEKIFLCVPNSVSVSGNISEALLQNEQQVTEEELVVYEEAPVIYEEVAIEEPVVAVEREEIPVFREKRMEDSPLLEEDIEEEKRRLGLTRR
jgi:Cell division protein SepF